MAKVLCFFHNHGQKESEALSKSQAKLDVASRLDSIQRSTALFEESKLRSKIYVVR